MFKVLRNMFRAESIGGPIDRALNPAVLEALNDPWVQQKMSPEALDRARQALQAARSTPGGES